MQGLDEDDLETIAKIGRYVHKHVERGSWLGRASARLDELAAEAARLMELEKKREASFSEKNTGEAGNDSAEEGPVAEREEFEKVEVEQVEVVQAEVEEGAVVKKEDVVREGVIQEEGGEEEEEVVQVLPRGTFFRLSLRPPTNAFLAVGTVSSCLRLPLSTTFADLLVELQRRDLARCYAEARCEIGGKLMGLDITLGEAKVSHDQQIKIVLHRLRGGADQDAMELDLDLSELNLEVPAASGAGLHRDNPTRAQVAALPNADIVDPNPPLQAPLDVPVSPTSPTADPGPASASASARPPPPAAEKLQPLEAGAAAVEVEDEGAEVEEEEGPAVRVETSRLELTFEEFGRKLATQLRTLRNYRTSITNPNNIPISLDSFFDYLSAPPEPRPQSNLADTEGDTRILDPSEDALRYAIWRGLDEQIVEACRQPLSDATPEEKKHWWERLDLVERAVEASRMLLLRKESTVGKEELERRREAWKKVWGPGYLEQLKKLEERLGKGKGKGKGGEDV